LKQLEIDKKAVIPPCDRKRLVPILEAHTIPIIEDACHAHAAEVDGKRVGGFDTGYFSVYATRNITSSEGGMVTTHYGNYLSC
jgi:perosamine synthetase